MREDQYDVYSIILDAVNNHLTPVATELFSPGHYFTENLKRAEILLIDEISMIYYYYSIIL